MWQNKALTLCDRHNIECIVKGLTVTFWCPVKLGTEIKQSIKETVPEKMTVSFRIVREKIIQNDDIVNLRISLGKSETFDKVMEELF